MNWESLYAEWANIREAIRQEEVPKDSLMKSLFRIERRIRTAISTAKPADLEWILTALQDNEKKWFVGWPVYHKTPPLHESLMQPLIRAGVYEPDPSFNKAFIVPCVRTMGPQYVILWLLDYIETGTDEEVCGAANALYWVQPNERFPNEPSEDLSEQIQTTLLCEFISNPHLDVRRSIIGKLKLRVESVPDRRRQLVEEALQIAYACEDNYIRNRERKSDKCSCHYQIEGRYKA
jgi:hypothetical protein